MLSTRTTKEGCLTTLLSAFEILASRLPGVGSGECERGNLYPEPNPGREDSGGLEWMVCSVEDG